MKNLSRLLLIASTLTAARASSEAQTKLAHPRSYFTAGELPTAPSDAIDAPLFVATAHRVAAATRNGETSSKRNWTSPKFGLPAQDDPLNDRDGFHE